MVTLLSELELEVVGVSEAAHSVREICLVKHRTTTVSHTVTLEANQKYVTVL